MIHSQVEHGLKRGGSDLRVHATCEIPDNVVQIATFGRLFGRLFDGFSIGSNHLAQLVLAVDRDSSRRESATEHSMTLTNLSSRRDGPAVRCTE
ncbi:MAG: putative PEP-binding protein [Gammaproteobacteria bacterium]